jgi:alkylated DNA repair dioxygenase AlkB
VASTRKTDRLTQPPDGFLYQKNLITPADEVELVGHIENLPLQEYEFYGYLAKRRTISFGWHYKFSESKLERANPIPEFLKPLLNLAAKFAGVAPDHFPHILITEYSPGTPIGWHRDRPVFEDVVGVSLVSQCLFRLRRKTPTGWERYTHILDPRSCYLLRGPVRTMWEHSIPPVDLLRYSITFRSLR